MVSFSKTKPRKERRMARTKSIGIRSQLKGLVSDQHLSKTARETGFVKRRRKIDPASFFWTLILGFAAGGQRQIAGMRRAYEASTGDTLVPSAFYDRFTPALTKFLKAVFAYVADKLAGSTEVLKGSLAWIKDLVVTDATVIRLHDALENAFAACRTNHTKAAAKVHIVMSVLGAGPSTVKISNERTHDTKRFTVGAWCRDRLLMFDLGYYRFALFDAIQRYGGYFLSRLKVNANPVIVAVHGGTYRDECTMIGQRLADVLPHLRRPVLDVEIEASFCRRVYAGVRSSARQRFRLVGILDEETREYHLYVTNLPVDKIPAADIGIIYRERWAVELTFKHLKSSFHLAEMPSRKKHVVESMIYASMLTLVASRQLLVAIREKLRRERHRLKECRWTRLFNTFADHILRIVNSAPRHAKDIARRLEPLLLVEILDPHLRRPSLLDQVQNGTTCYTV
jgi:IS4 transposase